MKLFILLDRTDLFEIYKRWELINLIRKIYIKGENSKKK